MITGCLYLFVVCDIRLHRVLCGVGVWRQGGAILGHFSVGVLKSYPLVRGSFDRLYDDDTVKYRCCIQLSALAELNNDSLVIEVPLGVVIEATAAESLKSLARAHGVCVSRSMLKADVVKVLLVHVCSVSCPTLSVFECSTGSDVNPYHVLRDAPVLQLFDDSRNVPVSAENVAVDFPPEPCSKREAARIISEYCDELSGAVLNESCCSVCGQLTAVEGQQFLDVSAPLFDVLVRDSVTRVERGSAYAAIRGHSGPVLCQAGIRNTSGFSEAAVCSDCLHHLRRHVVPKRSLANGLWVGDVPMELARLNFVEKLVVVRYRHNVCVVHVENGGYKMRGNAVVFSQPVVKFYDVLPPPRGELDEILVILFTGPVLPVSVDFKRTPLLVRRNVVWSALQWLKLNNDDYMDIILSEHNLLAYDEDIPPVGWFHVGSDGSAIPETLSVFESDSVKGTSDGMCSFAVHGASADEITAMGKDEKV